MSASTLPRRALWVLIGCQFYVVVPHLARVPWWVLAVYLGAAIWRLQMHRERATLPSRWVRFALGSAGMGAVVASYQTLIGLEPMVALLLVASGLKLVESVRIRDGYTLVSLGFFVITTEFLFDQTLPIAVYALVGSVGLITGLIAMNRRPAAPLGVQAPWLAVRMLALAIPMMAVLFVVFPRIGPLWSVPSKTGQGMTGMSDVLKPGDVSRLGRSAEVAFRVQFDGAVPDRSALYWRGMVLNHFDDGAWRVLPRDAYPPEERRPARPVQWGGSLSYRVIMEPTFQHWLYALPDAESGTPGVLPTPNNHLIAAEPLESNFAYTVTTWFSSDPGGLLSPWQRQTELAFPQHVNPKTRAWVTTERASTRSNRAFVEHVLETFRQQPFYYTLKPPVIDGEHFVDRFMFDVRRGFCEHYAYSFVVIMRMAGIPARIVGGYQGGEVNPLNNTVIVRQLDAHAWAEIWLEGVGWTRVDPTAAVAPERIEWGLEEALADDDAFLADSPLSAYRFRGIGMVNWLRLRYDAAAWRWQSFVVGFNSDRQLAVLQDWFGEIKVSWFVALMLGSWFAVLVPLTWWIGRARNPSLRLPEERQFARLCERLAKRGLTRGVGESPTALLARASRVLPQEDPLLVALAAVNERLYRGASPKSGA